MPQSLPQSNPPKRRFRWPKGMPQLVALLLVLLVDSLVAPHFYQVILQDGRLFGSPIDILNRAAPVALLAIGMTLVGWKPEPQSTPSTRRSAFTRSISGPGGGRPATGC